MVIGRFAVVPLLVPDAWVPLGVALGFWREEHRLHEPLHALGKIGIRLTNKTALDGALAQVRRKQGGLRPALLNIFDDRGTLVEREVVIEQHRHAPARREPAEFIAFEVAGIIGQHAVCERHAFVDKRQPCAPGIRRT